MHFFSTDILSFKIKHKIFYFFKSKYIIVAGIVILLNYWNWKKINNLKNFWYLHKDVKCIVMEIWKYNKFKLLMELKFNWIHKEYIFFNI